MCKHNAIYSSIKSINFMSLIKNLKLKLVVWINILYKK